MFGALVMVYKELGSMSVRNTITEVSGKGKLSVLPGTQEGAHILSADFGARKHEG